LHNLGQVIAERAVVQDNPAVRKACGQILLQLSGCRAKPDCANADRAARDEDLPKGAAADCELDFVRDAALDGCGVLRREVGDDQLYGFNSSGLFRRRHYERDRGRSLRFSPLY
jgi:hypothetical protein